MTQNHPDVQKLKSTALWDQAWQASISQRQADKKQKPEEGINRWNKRTREFAERSAGTKLEPRVQQVLDWFSTLDVKLDGTSILDIGAGSGSFALPFARVAGEVTALEPALQMAELLQGRASEAELTNIVIDPEPWETLDIDEKGYRNNFDLVFASMCPGINNWETLQKALHCARRYMFLSFFAGKRENTAIRDLWPRLTGTEQPAFTLDVFYAQNLLYLHGYSFDFRVFEEKRTVSLNPEQAIAHITKGLAAYNVPPAENTEQIVAAYVQEQTGANDGVMDITSNVRFGHVLVRVEDQ
ncbi:MAG: class I SAM-dependent methyltransferase [Clostridia bacterium]